jgi:hypothetical protein
LPFRATKPDFLLSNSVLGKAAPNGAQARPAGAGSPRFVAAVSATIAKSDAGVGTPAPAAVVSEFMASRDTRGSGEHTLINPELGYNKAMSEMRLSAMEAAQSVRAQAREQQPVERPFSRETLISRPAGSPFYGGPRHDEEEGGVDLTPSISVPPTSSDVANVSGNAAIGGAPAVTADAAAQSNNGDTAAARQAAFSELVKALNIPTSGDSLVKLYGQPIERAPVVEPEQIVGSWYWVNDQKTRIMEKKEGRYEEVFSLVRNK